MVLEKVPGVNEEVVLILEDVPGVLWKVLEEVRVVHEVVQNIVSLCLFSSELSVISEIFQFVV